MKIIKLLLVIILFSLFASIFTFQKINLEYAEPFFLMGSRMLIAGLILLIYTKKIKKTKIIINKKDIKFFIYLSIYNIYLNSVLEIWGLAKLNSSKVCLLYSLSPFLTAIISFIILKEKTNFKKIIGITIGFLGLLPIIGENSINIAKSFYITQAEISIILAVISSVLGWIFLKKIINLGYCIIMANGISMSLGGLLILINSFIFGENWNYLPIINIKNFIIITIITIIISNIICYNLFGYLLKTFSTTFMTFSGLTTPFFASLFGWVFLNEKITTNFFISIFIFLIGMIIFYIEETK